MLAEGKISVEEAERLLAATGEEPDQKQAEEKTETTEEPPKHLFISVIPEKEGKDRVNIKIPLRLVRTGMVLGSLMPEKAREKVNSALHEKGLELDLKNLKSENLDEMMNALRELNISVDDGDEKIDIYCA